MPDEEGGVWRMGKLMLWRCLLRDGSTGLVISRLDNIVSLSIEEARALLATLPEAIKQAEEER